MLRNTDSKSFEKRSPRRHLLTGRPLNVSSSLRSSLITAWCMEIHHLEPLWMLDGFQQDSLLTANVSGFAPASIIPTQIDSVCLSRPDQLIQSACKSLTLRRVHGFVVHQFVAVDLNRAMLRSQSFNKSTTN